MTFSPRNNTQLTMSLAVAGLLTLSLLVGLGILSPSVVLAAGETCFATLDGSTVYSSTDASAVQDAVNAASAGDTVKIAGTCTGVQTVSGQTQSVYINKNITLVGGYANGSWNATPDPVANPTVLDANSGGRVAIIDNSASVTMRHLTLRNGLVGGTQFGGAILVNAGSELLLGQSRIEESEAFAGGASSTLDRCRSSRAHSATIALRPAAPSTCRAMGTLRRL